MKLVKTPNVNSVPCVNGSVVCYNTILNLPIVLDPDSYNYFLNYNIVDLKNNQYCEDEAELINALKASFLLLPDGVSEELICEEQNIAYMSRVATGETIEFLDLRISEKCNFGCAHCISSMAQSNEIMDSEIAINVVDCVIAFLKERNPKFSKIDVHYGNAEPLINFTLIKEVQRHLRKKYPHLNKVVSINTNLSLLTEKMAEFLIKENIAIYASLDGVREANNSIRVFKNGKGTFDVIWKKMSLLKKKGKGLEGISVTITDANFPYFNLSFADWCAENEFRSVAMDFDLVNYLNIPLDERVDFIALMWEKCKKLGIEFFGTWITPFLNVSNRSIVNKHYAFCL